MSQGTFYCSDLRLCATKKGVRASRKPLDRPTAFQFITYGNCCLHGAFPNGKDLCQEHNQIHPAYS